MATVIASQALITGAYSLTTQAVQLDYLPRLKILHTSAQHIGQVYVPLVNWLLMIGCVGLVIGFRTSSSLASAYGIAVTTTMLITTMLFYRVVRDRWGWSTARSVITLAPLMLVDFAFLAANVPKIPTGGWFPLAVGFGLVIQMTTWRRGRELVAARIRRGERPMEEVGREALDAQVARVPGTAVYLFKDAGAAPPALVANLEHNKVLHETTLLAVGQRGRGAARRPGATASRTPPSGPASTRSSCSFGFMDEPDVPDALAAMDAIPGYQFDLGTTTFFLGREAVGAGKAPGMHPWREELFVLLNRGAASASGSSTCRPTGCSRSGRRSRSDRRRGRRPSAVDADHVDDEVRRSAAAARDLELRQVDRRHDVVGDRHAVREPVDARHVRRRRDAGREHREEAAIRACR